METAPRALHHLNCGTMCPRGARLLVGQGGLLATARIVCHCLLIEGAESLVLVDTGFGVEDTRTPRQLGLPFVSLIRPRLDVAETALVQVRELGFDPGDVRHIVTTHLDLDHAEVHVLGRELDAALHAGWRERRRYVAAHWAHRPRWTQHEPGGEEWFGFESVRILPGSDSEILLIPLSGHTLGHAGVAVRRGDGWLLHCGDAYFHHGEVQTPASCPPGIAAYQVLGQVDGEARRQNRERLRELARRRADDVELICSHDASYLASEQQTSTAALKPS